ncbi:DUF2591 domain-containing protein [Burkholderia arboris]|uniref:DUF2591 domain-containing protein n=1 Tax=Burkholderia arboris TaxID=488730 RepID=A0ABZ3DPD8_9BURK
MKVADLACDALDYWVAKADGLVERGTLVTERFGRSGNWICGFVPYRPSSDWLQGGPIIDRVPFGIFERFEGKWAAGIYRPQDGPRDLCIAYQTGDTLLIAAMRAYVASKFGEEVPDEGC